MHLSIPQKGHGGQQYLGSPLVGNDRDSRRLHPSSCWRRTRTSPWPAAHGGYAGPATATAGSRWHGAAPCGGTPAAGHPATCRRSERGELRGLALKPITDLIPPRKPMWTLQAQRVAAPPGSALWHNPQSHPNPLRHCCTILAVTGSTPLKNAKMLFYVTV